MNFNWCFFFMIFLVAKGRPSNTQVKSKQSFPNDLVLIFCWTFVSPKKYFHKLQVPKKLENSCRFKFDMSFFWGPNWAQTLPESSLTGNRNSDPSGFMDFINVSNFTSQWWLEDDFLLRKICRKKRWGRSKSWKSRFSIFSWGFWGCSFAVWKSCTLPETNIAPENGWLEYYFAIGEAYYQGLR